MLRPRARARVPLLLCAALAVSCSPGDVGISAQSAHQAERQTRSIPHLPGPIVGDLVTLEVAKARVDFPIPLLPPDVLVDPCAEGSELIALAQVWASAEQERAEESMVGLTYNLGLWLSVGPVGVAGSDVIGENELIPAEEVFDATDYPTRLSTGAVRGHVAWVTELPPTFSCGSNVPWGHESEAAGIIGSPPVRTIDRTPTISLDGPYHFEQAASLMWVENETIVHITGPFSIKELADLTIDLAWV